MAKCLIKQAEEFFKETNNEWYAFLELVDNYPKIISSWYLKCKHELNKRFDNEELDNSNIWLYLPEGDFHFKWYIKEFGEKSLGLCLDYSTFQLCTHDISIFDPKIIVDLLKTSIYTPIISAFQKYEIGDGRNGIIISENGNFSFEDKYYDGEFDKLRLAWYANYETNQLVDQIVAKVNSFRKNGKLTELIKELNIKARRNN